MAAAVARAKAMAQDAVKSDTAGAINQALVGYRQTLKEIEEALMHGASESLDLDELRRFATVYQDRIEQLTGERPVLNIAAAPADTSGPSPSSSPPLTR